MRPPSEAVRREFERYLTNDQSRVGEVFRLSRRGLNPHQIADELDVSTSGFVSNYRTKARTLLEGSLPNGPTMAQEVLRFVRKVHSSKGLSAEASAYLEELEAVLGSFVHGDGEGQRKRTVRTATAQPAPSSSLRNQVDEELRRRTKALVERIQSETDVEALDYRSLVASDRPLDAVVRVIRWRGDDGTFDDLLRLGRRDLTLEQAVVSWSEDLPLTADLVDEAAARIDWTT